MVVFFSTRTNVLNFLTSWVTSIFVNPFDSSQSKKFLKSPKNKKNAFKNYDVIFSNGPYQTNELKKAEEVFSFPQKKIFDIGYFYLDYLKNNAKTNLSKKNCVLFAPSWNYNDKNLFDDYGYKIIEKLISKNFHVILRPHSEHFKRSKKKINQIKNSLDKNLFTLDINLSNIP